jgi:hypothetical protein
MFCQSSEIFLILYRVEKFLKYVDTIEKLKGICASPHAEGGGAHVSLHFPNIVNIFK